MSLREEVLLLLQERGWKRIDIRTEGNKTVEIGHNGFTLKSKRDVSVDLREPMPGYVADRIKRAIRRSPCKPNEKGKENV